ncbi:OOP family OmpA-OmpF porin [Rhodobacter sp. JA431]|uniref:OmpA family protein n=1 Tax=Rhodobacter sp. JA431 TaxID=570013 RepID=UPI000BCB5CBE|nr:OmpA family protein [Rhodobacter sp. JA431]SOC07406.1 OOP family OmpA-OmpF porin [Rhodobacter sp. JA431]
MKRWLALPLICLAAPAVAAPLQLTLPQGAMVSAERAAAGTSYEMRIGPWQEDSLASQHLEGSRTDRAWRLRGNQETSLQIFAPLRAQIEAAGYAVVYECETDACGGFDFRYALDLLPEPEMHVDLGDFRYLAARRGDDWLALTVSRSSESGFVHLTNFTLQEVAAPVPATPLAAPQPSPQPQAEQTSDLGTLLEAEGAVPLDDLVFESGAAALGNNSYETLASLADYLAMHPDARVALVGHTDNSGSLAGNIALSKRRAEAVRQRLISVHGVSPAQLSAEGAGWLAPRASNLTPEGREQNRRVEAVLASTPK